MSGRGLPSWHKYRAYGPVYEEIRLAEHAVRLGSPVSFDRRGDVIFLEDFEYGLGRWETGGLGGGYAVTPSVDSARSKGVCAKLTAGNTLTRYASLHAILPFPQLTKMGVELSFTLDESCDYAIFYVYLYDGTNYHRAIVRYTLSTKLLEINDEDNNWQTVLSGWEPFTVSPTWNTLKVVFDPTTELYSRLVLNDRGVSLTDYGLRVVANTSVPQIYLWLAIYGLAATNAVMRLDNIIVTQNEP